MWSILVGEMSEKRSCEGAADGLISSSFCRFSGLGMQATCMLLSCRRGKLDVVAKLDVVDQFLQTL